MVNIMVLRNAWTFALHRKQMMDFYCTGKLILQWNNNYKKILVFCSPVDFCTHSLTFLRSLPHTLARTDAWILTGEWQKPDCQSPNRNNDDQLFSLIAPVCIMPLILDLQAPSACSRPQSGIPSYSMFPILQACPTSACSVTLWPFWLTVMIKLVTTESARLHIDRQDTWFQRI